MWPRLLVTVLGVCVLLCSAHAKVVKGEFDGDSHYEFLSLFCYNTKGIGNLEWTIWTSDVAKNNYVVSIYDDSKDSWYKALDTSSCEKKLAAAKLNESVADGAKFRVKVDDLHVPHYWFVAISNCGHSKMDFEYEITFLNAGDHMSGYQFSLDDSGLLAIAIVFECFYLLLTGLVGWAVHQVKVVVTEPSSSRKATLVFKLFAASTFIITAAFMCFLIHYAVYSSNGIGVPGLQGFGELLVMTSNVLFIAIFLLLAKGYPLTATSPADTSPPPLAPHKPVFVVTLAVCVMMYIAFFIYMNIGVDPWSTLSVWENPVGIIVLCVRAGVFGVFIYFLYHTVIRDETGTLVASPSKKRMYIIIAAVGSAWLVSLPLFVGISAGIPPYDRHRMVAGSYNPIFFCVHALFCVWMWPSWHTSYGFRLVAKMQPGGDDDLKRGTRKDVALLAGDTPYEEL